MAPNFKINNISLFQCSAAELGLLIPSTQVAKNVVVHAASTPSPVTDSDSYWESDSNQEYGLTVDQFERKKAALARVQARIEKRRAEISATAQPREFRVSTIQETLEQDSERRGQVISITDCYWMDRPHTEELVQTAPLSDNYWSTPATHSDGTTADLYEIRTEAVRRIAALSRIHSLMSEYRSDSDSKSSARNVVSMDLPSPCLIVGNSYWDC